MTACAGRGGWTTLNLTESDQGKQNTRKIRHGPSCEGTHPTNDMLRGTHVALARFQMIELCCVRGGGASLRTLQFCIRLLSYSSVVIAIGVLNCDRNRPRASEKKMLRKRIV